MESKSCKKGGKSSGYAILLSIVKRFPYDHSRMIVGARIFFEDNTYNFQKVLKDAVATTGIPTKLYCDYTEEKTIPKEFRVAA